MLEGLMQWIESSIPSQIDAAIENRAYQRYYLEKQKLQSQYPQVRYFDNRYPERIIKWQTQLPRT
jgi:hypothetical protein